MARPTTICLNMIVKNEAHVIKSTLTTLLKYIRFDYWVIVDTGSTDKTIEIIEAFFAKHAIPGKIYETPWKDFGSNRTDAFEKAFGLTDYVFVWDADDSIHGRFVLPGALTADSYRFKFGDAAGIRFSRPQLFNNRKKWKYVGVLHEYSTCMEACGQPVDVTGDYYFVSGRSGSRNKDPQKYLNDAEVLERACHEAIQAKDPIHNRYAFYCAQSYKCAGKKEAALEWYKKVLATEAGNQEKYVSCMEIYDLCESQDRAPEGLSYLVDSYRYDRERVECFYRLIKYYCIRGMPEIALMYYGQIQNYYENIYCAESQVTKLFVKHGEHTFYLPYYVIIVTGRLKKHSLSAKMYDIIFKHGFAEVAEWWIHHLFTNMQFCLEEIPIKPEFLENMFAYIGALRHKKILLKDSHNEIITRLVERFRPVMCDPSTALAPAPARPAPPMSILFSMTTCKRLDLFKQTMYSILNNWLDIGRVDHFLCVDDNSSEADRQEMKATFPFFEYVFKGPEEKGHRESMNIIWTKLNGLKPTFWIHMEDDWMYFQKKAYITEGIKYLDRYEGARINQVVFNKNYGDIYSDMGISGGIEIEREFLLHEKRSGLPGKNCGYWPHYSLRPSIVRTKVILELGNYDSANTSFEKDYAIKYHSADYQTGFFPSIYSLHIGKQHWEKEGKNAYALNETAQFNPK